MALSIALLAGSLALAAVMTVQRGAVTVSPAGWDIAFKLPPGFQPAGERAEDGDDRLRYVLTAGERRAALLQIDRYPTAAEASIVDAAVAACRSQLSFVDRLTASFEPMAAPVGVFDGVEVQWPPGGIAVRAFHHAGHAYTFTLKFQHGSRGVYQRFDAMLASVAPVRSGEDGGR